jgi:hypothetical protein
MNDSRIDFDAAAALRNIPAAYGTGVGVAVLAPGVDALTLVA